MRRRSPGPGFLLLLSVLLWQARANAQQAAPGTQGVTQGTLTVTVTVVSSVGVVIGPGGEQHLFIANAADPADNISRLQLVVMAPRTPAAPGKAPVKAKKKSAVFLCFRSSPRLPDF